MTQSYCLIDDEGRECTLCHEYKPWSEFSRKARSSTGYASRCKECYKLYYPEPSINGNKLPNMAAKKRWVCMYDPQNFFAGSFSTMEFELGLESGIWPHDSVWYNRDTRCYYRIAQKTAKFKNKMAMSQFVGWRRNGAQHEKPPVAERQAYAR